MNDRPVFVGRSLLTFSLGILVLQLNLTLGYNAGREKVSDTKSAKHPQGRSGFWCRTPFPGQPPHQMWTKH